MNVLVIGNGGREHALIWALKKSKDIKTIYAAPGNGGTKNFAENVLVNITSPREIIGFCTKNEIGLVVVGPEAPLVAGLADELENAGILVFGPSAAAARLEGSKEFTKKMCIKANIPTAEYKSFTDADDAIAYINEKGAPIVVKADGLAAGKGVVVAQTIEEAEKAVKDMLVDGQFGEASSKLVIEECLIGEEVSFFAICDGDNGVSFGSAQDHKAVGEGDTGPNTGGMGTYSPAPVMTQDLHDQVMDEVVNPLLRAMKEEGCPFKGVLFVGLMVTDSGAKVLEYNVRFGDPEAQVLMARLKSDLLPLLVAASKGQLKDYKVELDERAALCVVMAAKGYPGDYHKNTIINHVDRVSLMDDVIVFHAGTHLDENNILKSIGGRVLGVTAVGTNVVEAQKRAYEAVDSIEWPEGFCRRDIGWRAIERERK